jgi:hypothetical protein
MAASELNIDRAAYRPVRLSSMLDRAHELATNGATKGADNKTAISQNANSITSGNVAKSENFAGVLKRVSWQERKLNIGCLNKPVGLDAWATGPFDLM